MNNLYNKLNLEVAKFASTTEIKPALASVAFMDGKTVATDSARLVEISTPKNQNAEDYPETVGHGKFVTSIPKMFLIPAKAVKALKVVKPNKHLAVLNNVALFLSEDKKNIEMVSTNIQDKSTQEARLCGEDFPDYEQLFHTGEFSHELYLNGALLAEMLVTLGKVGVAGGVTIKIPKKESKVNIIEIHASGNGQSARALLSLMITN